MRCPSCGKDTPAGTFCLHCGAHIASAVGAPRAPADWEYKDFVYDFPPPGRGMWARIGAGAYSEAGAKLEFWQNYQRDIHAELQKWLDDGWEPVGPVDSGCIEIRTSRSHRDKGCSYWTWVLIISLFTWGLALLFALFFGMSTIAEPVRCVIPMRRPKPNLLAQPTSLPLPAVPMPRLQPRNQPPQQFTMCPRCAHMNRVGAKFCSRCGQTLQ